MTITEIKKTIIELSDEEKEILKRAGDILYELYEADSEDSLLYDLLEGTLHENLTDFSDISFALTHLCEKSSFCTN